MIDTIIVCCDSFIKTELIGVATVHLELKKRYAAKILHFPESPSNNEGKLNPRRGHFDGLRFH